MFVAHGRDEFLGEPVVRGAGLEHDEASRHLALDFVGDADHRALGHRRVGGQHRLDGAGGQPVPGHVDDVVDAAHHEQVAVLVEVAAVAGEVVAGMLAQVRRLVAVVVVPQRRQACPAAAAARCRSRPPRPARTAIRRCAGCARRSRASAPSVSPGLIGSGSTPMRIGGDRPAGLGLPPVVDDRDAELLRRPVRRCRGRAARRPGTGTSAPTGRSWPRCLPSGSSLRIARIAVGAVNSAFTPCSAATRQNAPGSGVPTGLPS